MSDGYDDGMVDVTRPALPVGFVTLERCPDCDGFGDVAVMAYDGSEKSYPCNTCGGAGLVEVPADEPAPDTIEEFNADYLEESP